MWPAWSHPESSLEPSDSSTRMPQTKRAALMLRLSRAFRMRELASGHRRLASSFRLGSSMVMASWGRRAFVLREGGGFWFGLDARSALVKSGAQDTAEMVLSVESRNLRRSMVI